MKIVLFQIIQFSISTQFSSRTLSGATTPSQSGPERDDNEGLLRIPQSSSITGTSPSACLCHIQDTRGGGVLSLCREAVGVFYSLTRLRKRKVGFSYG